MRRKRVKIDSSRVANYHVMNRVGNRAYLFDEEASDAFCRIMRRVAEFTGVKVVTYCVMTNHFHMLLHIPERKKLCEKEVFARFKKLAARSTYMKLMHQYELYRGQENTQGMSRIKESLEARMYDLSAFMKEVKQRFTAWYNDRHGRTGPFWDDRFKSVLVEGKGYTLVTVAVYIDLNPVRALMVTDPKDHRWCGYAAALAGNLPALEGLKFLLQDFLKKGKGRDSDRHVLAVYRTMLFGRIGKHPETMSAEDIEKVYVSKGILPPWEFAQHRMRWVTEGVIIGGKAFVQKCAESWHNPLGFKRKCPEEPEANEEGWFSAK